MNLFNHRNSFLVFLITIFLISSCSVNADRCASGWNREGDYCKSETFNNPTVSCAGGTYTLGAGGSNPGWVLSGNKYCNDFKRAGSTMDHADQDLCGPYCARNNAGNWEYRDFGCAERGGASSIRCEYPYPCSSHAYTSCYGGHIYWYDSCGDVEGLYSYCSCGCSGSSCLSCCTPQYYNNCDSTNGCGGTRATSPYNSCDLTSNIACGSEPAGCNGVDNNCDGIVDNTGLSEVCNSADDDCDGQIDEGGVCCNLNSVEVTSLCTGLMIGEGPQKECLQGDQVLVEAAYTAACGSPRYLQVDMSSDDCYINRADGDITGISLACSNGACEGFWEVPFVPETCRGEQMSIDTADLYTSSNYTEWLTGPATTTSGSIILSESYIPSLCNNGIIDAGETCDFSAGNPIFGDKLDGTCTQFNDGVFTAGNLGCLPTCQIDTSSCTGPTGTCGNSVINPGETCDGSTYPNVEGTTESSCNDYDSFKSGTLACSNCVLSTSSCSVVEEGTHGCGNNLWEAPEECDGTDEAGLANCAALIPDAQEVSCTSPREEGECTCIGYGAGTIMEREAGSCSYDEGSGKFFREVKYKEIDGVTGETKGETSEQEECSLEPKKVQFFTATNILFVVVLLVMFYIFRIYMNKPNSVAHKKHHKKDKKRRH